MLGPGSDRDPQGRGTDRRASRSLHHRHRDPQYAAGSPRLRSNRLHDGGYGRPHRRARRGRPHQSHIQYPEGQAYRGLCDRQIRVGRHGLGRYHAIALDGGSLVTRERFAQQLHELSAATVLLGEQAAAAVAQAIQAFTTYDPVLASRVVDEDPNLNRMERQILDDASVLLALQAPVARDLRRILGVSRVASDFERIGDHARDIARAALRLAAPPLIGDQGDLDQLITQAEGMLRDGLRSYAEGDVDLARAVCKVDDGVDSAYAALFRDLLTEMVEDSGTIARATYTLFVARDIERIADRMANVAETTIYIATGETAELN